MAFCALIVAMGATSCKKDNKDIAGDRMTIGATISQHGDDGSKTEIGPDGDAYFPVLWSENDVFTLYSRTNSEGATFEIKDGVGTESAEFEGVNPGGAPYYASYPAGVSRTSETTFSYLIPQEQSSLNHAGPMVGYSEDGRNVSFENAMSWVRIGLKGNAKVTKVELAYSANKAHQYNPLSGLLTIIVNEDGKISSTRVEQNKAGDVQPLYRTCDVTLNTDYQYFDFLVPEGAFGSPNKDSDVLAQFTVYGTGDAVLATIKKAMPTIERNMVYVGVYDAEINKPSTLPGLFSVSDTKQVYFSKGNLRAIKNGNDWSWGFYDNQYECNSLNGGNSGREVTADDAEIDLFTWGYGTWSTDPVTTLYQQLPTDFVDWGKMIDDKWFTLSLEEWQYLFNITPNAKRADRYKIGVTVCGKANCLVMAPDNWNLDQYPLQDEYSSTSTPLTWEAAQEAGLACLPISGQRWGNVVSTVGTFGAYWTSSYVEEFIDPFYTLSPYIYFYDLNSYHDSNPQVIPGTQPRDRGFAVRLVTLEKD